MLRAQERIMLKTIVTGIALFFGFSKSMGAPIEWAPSDGGNGHYYDFINDPNITWTDAKAAAAGQVFDGVHGYLTTITSAAENAFMASNFSAEAGPFQDGWVGGYQDTGAPDYSEPDGGWRWVTGEPWVYTNWFTSGPVEPDNAGGDQNYLRSNVGFQWDDFQNDPSNPSVQYISGYFVEFTVPEPASVGIIAMSSLLTLRRRRER